jgi:hypothetical protein
MSVPLGARYDIKPGVQHPMENEKQLNLLKEVNFFMANQFSFVFGEFGNPYKNEK